MRFITVLLITFFISFNVHADGNGEAEKPFNIGIGLYDNTITYENSIIDDELSGTSISIAYAISDQVGLRATFFSLEHDDVSAIDSDGYDLVAYIGSGLASNGFKAYIGGGIYKEEWKLGPIRETFSGLQLNGGLGYSWESVSVDVILGLRDAGDYEDFVNAGTAVAVSSMFLVSARF